ncbi:MAG: hypothetical protein WCD78_22935 [Pseudolabrys sp.]
MNLKLTVAVLLITALPVFAQAQKPNAVVVTPAEARKVLEIIKGDKAKRYGQARSRDGRG